MVGRQFGLPMIFPKCELCPVICHTKTYLSVIIVNQRRRYRIDTLWEIHHSRCISPRHAHTRCTSSTFSNRPLNRSRIICHSVAYSTIILYIPEDLVAFRPVRAIRVEAHVRRVLVERCNTLVLDILHPVRRTRAVSSRLRNSSYWFLSRNQRGRTLVSNMRDGMLVPSIQRNGSANKPNGSESKETHLDSLTSDCSDANYEV